VIDQFGSYTHWIQIPIDRGREAAERRHHAQRLQSGKQGRALNRCAVIRVQHELVVTHAFHLAGVGSNALTAAALTARSRFIRDASWAAPHHAAGLIF
jgi:hypothetical protein